VPKYFCFEVRLFEIEPPIRRKFLIRTTATFQDLHDAIQEAAGWWDYHLFLFRAGDEGPVIAGKPGEGDPFGAPDPDAESVRLDSYFGKRGQRSCQYCVLRWMGEADHQLSAFLT
jgi:hypothetical protein